MPAAFLLQMFAQQLAGVPDHVPALQGHRPVGGHVLHGQHGSFDRCRLNHAKYLSADRLIDGDATERDATGLAIIQEPAMTRIPQHIMSLAGISYRQLTTTSAASQEASQQRLTVTGGTGVGFT